MDDQFARFALEGVSKLPNIHQVHASFASKNSKVEAMLAAFGNVKVFPEFSHQFALLK